MIVLVVVMVNDIVWICDGRLSSWILKVGFWMMGWVLVFRVLMVIRMVLVVLNRWVCVSVVSLVVVSGVFIVCLLLCRLVID